MEFRILGPLEVRDASGVVPIPGRHHPKLLAMLLLDADHVVPLYRLVEALWDQDPPVTARRQAQNAMATLRRLLPGRIESVGEGYRLTLATDRLDASVFTTHVRAARRFTAAGRHAEAHERLSAALDLWRGPALAGMSGRLPESAAERWNEERLVAQEARMAAELAMGQPGRVVGEARRLLEAHPYRQGLAVMSMRALHQSGRTEEALAVYRGVRRRFAADLGIEPGRPLRDLHREILRQGPEPARPPVPVTAAPTVPIPAQLPQGGGFTGRADELAALDVSSADGTGPVVISGPGGVGKSALAVEWASRHLDRFPDGQLFVDLRGYDEAEPLTAQDALDRFLRALGHPPDAIPTDVQEAAALFRSRVSERRMLVLLDNAASVDQVRPLLPGGRGCRVLVTSRDRLAGLVALDDARAVSVPVMETRDSVDMLRRVVGDERVAAEPAAAARLAELCGHLPLALRIAAANLAGNRHRRLGDLVAELENSDRLAVLAIEGDLRAAVRANLDLSHRALTPDARDLFCRLGIVPGEDFSHPLVVAVSGRSEPEAGPLVARLLSGHLLEEYRPGRYRMHDLVRLYAADRADRELPPDRRAAVVDAVIDWHHERAYDPGAAEAHNMLRAAETLGDHPRLWRLVFAMRQVLNEGRSLARVRKATENGLANAERAGDRVGVFRMTSQLANVMRKEGDLESALRWGSRAVLLSRGIGPREEAAAKGNLGVYLSGAGRAAEAEKLLTEAVDLAAATGNVRSQLIFVNTLLQVCTMVGAFDKAYAYLADADAADLAEGGHFQARLRIYRGTLLTAQFRTDEALEVLAEAHAMAKAAGDGYLQGWCLAMQAESHRRAGRLDVARRLYREELRSGRSAERTTVEFESLCDLAEVEAAMGDYEQAAALMSEAAVSGPAPSESGRAQWDLIRAMIHNGHSRHRPALESATSALRRYRAMPWLIRQADALRVLAEAHDGLGDHEAAVRCRAEAEALETTPREPD
ncbi:DNA-binding SARP family transcriptional activator [Stackebrandtia albiflava]|uniref:DNA-binding SARP family transcriptional activator n=1 Tax=Stackebrandtia albiflava TaxID=406432 RepID=A0A562VA22_9ACTN|nr:BTAD domain-containing putative transcriptional regulator [Stackebrandtia albiflava]TWJ14698.1 DNA-binding SARP family transcriptional activator [Stackebrandtia albiflava]